MSSVYLTFIKIYFLIWPALWGILYIYFDIWVDDATPLWLGYLAVWMPSMLLFFAAKYKRGTEKLSPINPTIIRAFLLITFIVAVFDALFLAAAPLVSIVKLIMMIPSILALVAAIQYFSSLKREDIANITASFSLGMVFYVVLIFPMLPDYFIRHSADWETSIVPFFNIRRFTHVVIISIVSGTGYFIYIMKGSRPSEALTLKVLIYFCIIFGWTVMFWAGSRAPVLAFSVSMMIFLWRLPSQRIILLMSCAPAMVIAYFASGKLHFLNWNRTLSDRLFQFGSDVNFSNISTLDVNSISSGRIEVWKAAWTGFLQSPWFGNGYSQYSVVSGISLETPHNFILEMLHNFGIVGGVPIIIALVWTVYSLIKRVFRSPNEPLALTGGLVVCVMAIQSLVDGVFASPYLVFLFSIFAAIAWVATQKNQHE